jgi:hypothetical protein
MNLNNFVRKIDENQTKEKNLKTSKKIIFVTIATKINEIKIVEIDICKFEDNFFDEASITVNHILNFENEYKIKTMININCIKYFLLTLTLRIKYVNR